MDNTIAFNDPILSSIMFDTDANVDKSMNTATFQINDDDGTYIHVYMENMCIAH